MWHATAWAWDPGEWQVPMEEGLPGRARHLQRELYCGCWGEKSTQTRTTCCWWTVCVHPLMRCSHWADKPSASPPEIIWSLLIGLSIISRILSLCPVLEMTSSSNTTDSNKQVSSTQWEISFNTSLISSTKNRKTTPWFHQVIENGLWFRCQNLMMMSAKWVHPEIFLNSFMNGYFARLGLDVMDFHQWAILSPQWIIWGGFYPFYGSEHSLSYQFDLT